MKDYLIGVYVGFSCTAGMWLWVNHVRTLGLLLIVSGWFVGVVVYNRYKAYKK